MKKMYSIGSVVEESSVKALKRARKIYKGRNVSVKLYAKGYPRKGLNDYAVYSPRGISQDERIKLRKLEISTRRK
jgi:hypothetical protein